MEHYLFVARSVTHAQHMAKTLSDAGVFSKIRRAGTELTERGCGYTLELAPRSAARAAEICRAAGAAPVKVLRVSGGVRQEVSL